MKSPIVEKDGKLYEIGKRYLFLDHLVGVVRELNRLTYDNFVDDEGLQWPECIEIDRPNFGKITEAPPWQPEDNTAYFVKRDKNDPWIIVEHRNNNMWVFFGEIIGTFQTDSFCEIDRKPIRRD
jgi:hypothetical protein